MTAPRIASFSLIDADDLPDYPIARGDMLSGHHFTMWRHHQWLGSTLHLKGSYEVQGAALNLFFMAQTQNPVGTLPNDDELLARMLRMDIVRWRDLCAMSIGPLHNWKKCRCGNEVRLMHETVLQVLQEAMAKREARDLSKEEKAVAQRLKRLREGLSRLKVDKAVLADEILIRRMDEWLTTNWKGNRTAAAYDRVIMVAAKERWIGAI